MRRASEKNEDEVNERSLGWQKSWERAINKNTARRREKKQQKKSPGILRVNSKQSTAPEAHKETRQETHRHRHRQTHTKSRELGYWGHPSPPPPLPFPTPRLWPWPRRVETAPNCTRKGTTKKTQRRRSQDFLKVKRDHVSKTHAPNMCEAAVHSGCIDACGTAALLP